MRPPYHPRHVESIHQVLGRGDWITWSCSCGKAHPSDFRLAQIPRGEPTIARLIADEMNAHRETYVEAS